jgi:hypothetical protein
MSGEPQDIFRDERGRYKPGFNTRITKRMRVAVRLEELRREYFPAGGESVMDANRLKLAAQHYFTAETAQGAVVAQRATRIAEYLLAKLSKPASSPPAPRPPAAAESGHSDAAKTAKELLERLGKGNPSVA